MFDKICGMLGLARRAGKIVIGSESVLEAIRKETTKNVYMASDVSNNTAKKIKDACVYHKANCYVLPIGAERLSDAIGKKGLTAAVSISDGNFCKAVKKAIDEDGGCVVYGSNTEQE